MSSIALQAAPRVLIRATNIVEAAAGTNAALLYMVAADGLVSEATVDEGRIQRAWQMQASPTAFDVSPDGRYVALGYPIGNGDSLPLHIIDTQTGDVRTNEVAALEGETAISGLRFASNGKLLILANTGFGDLTRLRSYEPRSEQFHTFTNEINRSSFVESDDRTRIATVFAQLGWYSAGSDTYETSPLPPGSGPAASSLTVRLDHGFLNANAVHSDSFERLGLAQGAARTPYGTAKPAGRPFVVQAGDRSLRILETNRWTISRVMPLTETTSSAGKLRMLRLIDAGRRAVVIENRAVEIIPLEEEPFRLVSAHHLHATNRIVLRFSSPPRLTNLRSNESYVLNGGEVVQAAPHPQFQEMVVLTVSGSPTTVRVRGLASAYGDEPDGADEVAVQNGRVFPDEDGLDLEGHQESFDANPGSQWMFVAGTNVTSMPSNFRVRNGALEVSGVRGTNQYMLLTGAYDGDNQEVLMRVGFTSTSPRPLAPVAGVGLRPGGSGTDDYFGAEFLSPAQLILQPNFGSTFGTGTLPLELPGQPGYMNRAEELLLPTGAPNTWYWLRLRHTSAGNPNGVQMLAKWWPADGTVPEPSLWLEGRYSRELTATNPITGLAGLLGPNQSGAFKVDYLLIRAAGLPQTRVRVDGSRPPVWAQEPQDSWGTAGGMITVLGTASGEAPLSYRWFGSSGLITSNTTGQLRLAVTEDNGPFTLVASNPYGSITSAPVFLRIGSRRQYVMNISESGSFPEWSGARRLTDGGTWAVLIPSDTNRMTLALPNTSSDETLVVHARVYLTLGREANLRVSSGNAPPLYHTTISSVSTRGPSGRLSFQSFPASHDEALLPPLTTMNSWGAFDFSTSPRGGGFPSSLSPSTTLSFEIPGGLTNLVFDGGTQLGLASLALVVKPAGAPRIGFERAVFQVDDTADELVSTVVRKGGTNGAFSVQLLAKWLPDTLPGFPGVPPFTPTTNILSFPSGADRVTHRIALPPAPRSRDVRLSLALTNPVGFELESGVYALGLAASSLEPAQVELPEGDILSEGRALISVRVSSTNTSTAPRAITVRLEPLDGAAGALQNSIYIRHGRVGMADYPPDGMGYFLVNDDLVKLPDRRWRVRLTAPYYGLKPAGVPLTVTMVDDDAEGFGAFGVSNPERLVAASGASFFVAQSFFESQATATIPGPVVRVDGEGRIDRNFHIGLDVMAGAGFVPLSDGGWLVSRSWTPTPALMRIRADGSFHPAFQLSDTNYVDFYGTQVSLNGDSGLFPARVLTNQTYVTELWRVDATGAVDESLRNAVGPIQGSVQSMARLTDGRVAIAGGFIQIGTNAISKLAVVSPDDGSVAAFGVFLVADTNQLAVFGSTTNGGVMISQRYQGMERVVRLRADGTEDPTFQAEPMLVGSSSLPVLTSDGGVLLPAAPTNLVRLTPAGMRDASFRSPDFGGGYVISLLPREDGSIVVCGYFPSVNGVSRGNIALLSRTGELLPWPAEPAWPAPPTGVSPVTRLAGTEATLSAVVIGGTPARYQWQRNGLSIPGATNLTLAATEPGNYRLAVIGSGVIRTSPEVAVQFVDPAARPRLSLTPPGDGSGWRASIITPDGFTHRIEASDDLQTWVPAEPADFDGPDIRLGEAGRPHRYYRVVVE